MAKVYVQIAIETEERADRWACRSPEFGFTVYGKTRNAARQEVNKALSALLKSFHGDLDAIERFLKKREVRFYDIQRDRQSTPDPIDHARARIQHDIRSGPHPASTEVSLEEVLVA